MRPSSKIQRQRILDAAAELFARDGFAGTRVDQIATMAGVNKRMLYHHVGAKAELFAAVLEDQAGRLNEDSLASRALWSLLLQEASHRDTTVLLHALVVDQSERSQADLERRLATSMFNALLPSAARLASAATGSAPQVSAAEQAPASGKHPGAGDQRKPRLRMMPQVTASGVASTRSSAKRSK